MLQALILFLLYFPLPFASHVIPFEFYEKHLSLKPFCSSQNPKGFVWKAKSIGDEPGAGIEAWDDGNTASEDRWNCYICEKYTEFLAFYWVSYYHTLFISLNGCKGWIDMSIKS